MITVTAAPADILTLAEAKAQVRVDGSDSDTELGGLITAITGILDGPFSMTGRCLADQTVQIVRDCFPGDMFIPVPGANAVDSITYFDSDNNSQSLTVATYFREVELDSGLLLERIIDAPATYDREDAVTITVSAGNGVPERIKMAAKLILARWFDERDADIPEGAKALVNLEKSGWVGS